MQFTFSEDNLDKRFAGHTFQAALGTWKPEIDAWQPEPDGETLIIWNSDYGWQPIFSPEGLGTLDWSE